MLSSHRVVEAALRMAIHKWLVDNPDNRYVMGAELTHRYKLVPVPAGV